jgi:hypothetical protein
MFPLDQIPGGEVADFKSDRLLGHTVFVPLLAGALFVSLFESGRWLWWTVCAVLVIASAVTAPTDSYLSMTQLGPVTSQGLTWQWPELPVLPFVGLLAAWSLDLNKRFWWAVLGAQWALVLGLLIASYLPFMAFPVGLWPRRFLLTEFYTVAVLLCWSGQRAQPWRRTILVGVGLAAVLQLVVTVRWATQPLREQAGMVWPLPYSEAKFNGLVRPERTHAVLDWIARAKQGERLDLDYGWATEPDENVADPQSALQQLYLAIGHEAFQRQVHLRQPTTQRFGSGCLPDGAPAHP